MLLLLLEIMNNDRWHCSALGGCLLYVLCVIVVVVVVTSLEYFCN